MKSNIISTSLALEGIMLGMVKAVVAGHRIVDVPITVFITGIHLPAQLHCCTVESGVGGATVGGSTVEGAAVIMLHMEFMAAFNLFTVATRAVGIMIISYSMHSASSH